nr:hypothetical protein CFP56_21292 [Quercus suber]
MVIETAKITSAWDVAADQLVTQIVVARQLGRIRRPFPRDEDSNSEQHGTQQRLHIQEAIMPSGARMWTDLPFLTEDLRSAWFIHVDDMTIVERDNLAGFCSRLSASGVCDPDITSCCLNLFRNSLETPQRMSVHDENITTEYGDRAPLSDFMTAIIAWLWYGSFQILSLYAHNHVSSAESGRYAEYSSRGQLLTDQGVATEDTGFNMSR